MITLLRISSPAQKSDVTLGYLILPSGAILATLELPDRHNQRSVSCIPTGLYDLAYLEASASGKYKRVYHVRDVPRRSGILIHNGNLASHTRGCILVGLRHGLLHGQQAVLASRLGMNKLRQELGQQSHRLLITTAQPKE